MKKTCLLFILLTYSFLGFNQTFTQNGDVNIPDAGAEVCSDVTVSSIGNIDGTYGLETVCIKINHTWDADLDIFLVAPDGTRVELSTDNGGSTANYGNGGTSNFGTLTCFDMAAATAITAGAAPFMGSFIPEGDLGDVNNGQNADGVWSLCVTDDAGGDTGFINSFTLTFSATPATPSANLAGNDCANPTRISCGGAVIVGETTVGLSDVEDDWDCSGFAMPNALAGSDHFYVVEWPDAANGGTIRIDVTNVADADATYLEIFALGSNCAPNVCLASDQMTIATGLFLGGNSFFEYTVGAGLIDYYFVIDSQGDGVDDAIDAYDIQAICFATGMDLDVNSNCTPIPSTETVNQGYYVTWNGVAPPLTSDAISLAAAGPYTVCENIYVENVGFEWLKYFDITLGECWINISGLSPDGIINGNYNPGDWTASIGGGTPNVLSWDFTGWPYASWGDGDASGYNCYLYTFCFDADIDPACNSATGSQNSISASDDGIGFGGGGAVNASNITIGSTGHTLLPVSLLSFNAKPVKEKHKYGVVLNWRTSSEINNDYYTIERSHDGFEFEEVFNVSGAGNSSGINNYFGVDEDPYYGVSYYRLKQTDFDGKFAYFDIVAVTIDEKFNELSVYPTPAKELVNISFEMNRESKTDIIIYNISGEKVFEKTYQVLKGGNELQIKTEDLSQGMYFVTLSNEKENANIKFIKK